MAENNEGGETTANPPAIPPVQHAPQAAVPRPVLAPVVVEFGDDKSRTITLDTIPFKVRVRGTYSRTSNMRRAIGDAMSRMPDIPGMRLAINFRESKATLFDPLDTMPELLKEISDTLQGALLSQGSAIRTPVKRVMHVLDADQFKTLILEIANKIKFNMAKVVEGRMPTADEIEAMPGDELFDPWNSNPMKPRYKKDAQKYYERLQGAAIANR